MEVGEEEMRILLRGGTVDENLSVHERRLQNDEFCAGLVSKGGYVDSLIKFLRS